MKEVKLEEKQKDLREKFNALEGSKREFIKQRSALDRKLVEIREEQLRIHGQFHLIQEMLGKKPSDPLEKGKSEPNKKGKK